MVWSNSAGLASVQPGAKAAKPPPDEPAPVCELYLYDAIGADLWTGEGITASGVLDAVKQAEAAGAKSISLFVNSPGGDVSEATAISSILGRFAGPKNVFVDGLCASAATFIAMAGDTVTTVPAGMWMIHNPWGISVGDARDMRKAAEDLDKFRETYVEAYVAKTGLSAAKVGALMDAETWMKADEAMAFGFTDVAAAAPDKTPDGPDMEPDEDEKKMSARAEARFTRVLAHFDRVPEHLRPSSRSCIAAMRTDFESWSREPAPKSRTGQPAKDPLGARVVTAK